MEKVKVVMWGIGAMGSGMAKMILDKEGIEIVGAIIGHPEKTNMDLGDYLGIDRKVVILTTSPILASWFINPFTHISTGTFFVSSGIFAVLSWGFKISS